MGNDKDASSKVVSKSGSAIKVKSAKVPAVIRYAMRESAKSVKKKSK